MTFLSKQHKIQTNAKEVIYVFQERMEEMKNTFPGFPLMAVLQTSPQEALE
jgi:hypothetical protein